VRRAQEDSTPNKGGASKRKLKKDRRAKRQELADEAQSECVTWDEDQELLLLKRMGWGICVGARTPPPPRALHPTGASRSPSEPPSTPSPLRSPCGWVGSKLCNW